MHDKGRILNIQRFSTSDGPGIRTVVFFKGCPLHCAWCHNPESQSTAPEIFYKKEMCIGCGACARICANGGHTFAGGVHRFDRKKCTQCTSCVEVCYANALEACGETRTAEEIMETLLRDQPFYEESGGGLTLSGGEPLMQYDFALSLLTLAKAHHLHTAIETSGFTNRDLAALNDCVDLWLYDIKLFSESKHIQYTGVSNRQILDNLDRLDRMDAHICLRCPIIPDINLTEKHFDELAELANRLAHVSAIHLEPYHPLAISKSEQLGRIPAYTRDTFLDAAVLEPYADRLRAKVKAEVVIL